MNRIASASGGLMALALLAAPALAQQPDREPVQQERPVDGAGPRGGFGPGQGGGRGFGRGRGGGPPGRGLGRGAMGRGRHDPRHDADHEVFEFLLEHHDKISRSVKRLPDGVETVTESKDRAVADKIKEHVHWMEVRIANTQPIRMRDPLFAELFRHTDKIEMEVTETADGVKVVETSDDPYVVQLIQAHADVVSGFVARGFNEAMKNHAVPGPAPVAATPPFEVAIAGHGKVHRLPAAAAQPRSGSKVCVDVTASADLRQLHPAVDKLARYVNLYRGGGSEPVEVELVAVLHGGATDVVLTADAYAAKHGTEGNPNFEALRALHEAGVEFLVCGQSLIGNGNQPDDVLVFAEVAVSALTAVVNCQQDGYAMVQIR